MGRKPLFETKSKTKGVSLTPAMILRIEDYMHRTRTWSFSRALNDLVERALDALEGKNPDWTLPPVSNEPFVIRPANLELRDETERKSRYAAVKALQTSQKPRFHKPSSIDESATWHSDNLLMEDPFLIVLGYEGDPGKKHLPEVVLTDELLAPVIANRKDWDARANLFADMFQFPSTNMRVTTCARLWAELPSTAPIIERFLNSKAVDLEYRSEFPEAKYELHEVKRRLPEFLFTQAR